MALQHIRSGTADKRPVASSLADGQLAINYQADSPGAFFKDSAGNLVKVGPIHVGSTAPNATPAGSSGNSLGEGWLDTSGVDAILKVWDGTAWTPAKALVSGDIEITSINNGPLAGFRNAIINGNFDIWQRGTTFNSAAGGSFSADRWFITYDGGGTRNITRGTFTLGQTDVPGEPTYHLSFAQTVAATGATFNNLNQHIESVRTFAGQQVTLSFYAKAAASITLPGVRLNQSFGSGGTPSAAVLHDFASNVVVGTSWQKYEYTATLSSISGKTLGTDGNDSLVLVFRLPVTGTFEVVVANVQVEPGPIATPFERRPIGTELALCQRYYQVHGIYGRSYANSSGTPVRADKIQFAPVEMRVAPTISFQSLSYIAASNAVADGVTRRYLGIAHTQSSTTVPGYSAGLALCDAEL